MLTRIFQFDGRKLQRKPGFWQLSSIHYLCYLLLSAGNLLRRIWNDEMKYGQIIYNSLFSRWHSLQKWLNVERLISKQLIDRWIVVRQLQPKSFSAVSRLQIQNMKCSVVTSCNKLFCNFSFTLFSLVSRESSKLPQNDLVRWQKRPK